MERLAEYGSLIEAEYGSLIEAVDGPSIEEGNGIVNGMNSAEVSGIFGGGH